MSALAATAIKQAATGIAKRYGASVGGPFQSELQSIRDAIERVRGLLEAERIALLHDGFAFIAQDDIDAARHVLTQASNREPRSAVVRFWLGVVLASQGRGDAEAELRAAIALNPFVVPPALLSLFDLSHALRPPVGTCSACLDDERGRGGRP